MTGPTGPTGATGPGLDDDLTRIVALSWAHGGVGVRFQDLVQVQRQSPNTIGFIVAFGARRTNNPADLRNVMFGPNTIDDNTFQMFVLEPIAGSTPGLEVWAKVPKEMTELIPLRIDALTAAGRVTQATEIAIPPGSTSVPCTGAGVMWHRELFGILKGRRLMIEIKADFIPDIVDNVRPRAVDGNFLLGTLPTGDRVPGGTFWSWVTLR